MRHFCNPVPHGAKGGASYDAGPLNAWIAVHSNTTPLTVWLCWALGALSVAGSNASSWGPLTNDSWFEHLQRLVTFPGEMELFPDAPALCSPVVPFSVAVAPWSDSEGTVTLTTTTPRYRQPRWDI